MKYGLIGNQLGHSFSPQLHRMIGGYDYTLYQLDESDLPRFFAQRDFLGINVTIPYKEAVLPYLDEISPAAAVIGAVNTVVNRNGRLWGYNTDFGGMIALIRKMGLDLFGKKVLILGSGGTAKTARAAADHLGALEIITVSRSGRSRAVTYAEAVRFHADADYIINATPCGMYPALRECPIDVAPFQNLQGVIDAIYNPLSTRLVLEARRRGIAAEGGLYMLTAQAVLASELFTGQAHAPGLIDTIFAKLLRQKRNLVLSGMPGCGKTSVGRDAAAMMGRRFVDLDREISQCAGQPIPQIFARSGEKVFRQLESQAVQEISGQTGLVIATGGGCILQHENVDALRQNGCLVLLDRPLAQLRPTEDRPLSDSVQKLEQLYIQRMPIYRKAADQIITTGKSVSETAQTVVRRFDEVLIP